jgi:hypothetical protein
VPLADNRLGVYNPQVETLYVQPVGATTSAGFFRFLDTGSVKSAFNGPDLGLLTSAAPGGRTTDFHFGCRRQLIYKEL